MLWKLLNLDIERNRITNGLFFAPDYVNVLEVNLELINQYPEVYNITLGLGMNEWEGEGRWVYLDEIILGIFISFLVISAGSLGYSLIHAEK